jgi:hypothetical protein
MTNLTKELNATLDDKCLALLDEFQERAAIKEFCGNIPREEAERQAYEEVNGKDPF